MARTQAQSSTAAPGSHGSRVSGATIQRPAPRPGESGEFTIRCTGGTVTASPCPWQSSGGTSRAHSSQASRVRSLGAAPGWANSRVRPRKVATGPQPGPEVHSSSSTLRPNRDGMLITSKARPQGSTVGAQGRDSHRARMLRGYSLAEASQASPATVTYSTD